MIGFCIFMAMLLIVIVYPLIIRELHCRSSGRALFSHQGSM
jgi:xanthine/uracil/vitamin C permease (AzgA family)